MKEKISEILMVSLLTSLSLACSIKSDSKDKTASKVLTGNLKNNSDPCQMAYEQIKNMAEGPEVFMESMFSYNDFQQIKDDFPDLENYFKLYKDIQEGRINADPNKWGYFNDSNPILILYSYEQENRGNLSKELTERLEEYYFGAKQELLNEGWIWDDIQYNDCKLSNYYHEPGIYEYANQSFHLPNMKEMTLTIIVNNEPVPIKYNIIETSKGWKLLLPTYSPFF
jgi:hypothetical protein